MKVKHRRHKVLQEAVFTCFRRISDFISYGFFAFLSCMLFVSQSECLNVAVLLLPV
jgi:hypothetical protein